MNTNKARYTKYNAELREKAFKLHLDGKTNEEIRQTLDIGDTSGVSRISQEDNWDLKKRMIKLQQNLATAGEIAKSGGNPSEALILTGGTKDLSATLETVEKRNAQILGLTQLISEQAIGVMQEMLPRNYKEAFDVWMQAVTLERKLMGMTLEESFIVAVFDILRRKIQDVDLLKSIGAEIKLLMKKEGTNVNTN